MKSIILYAAILISSIAFSNTSLGIDISYKLNFVSEDVLIDGLDQSTTEGVIYVTESLHLEGGAKIRIKNACLIIIGDLSGFGTLEIDDTATVKLGGEKKGKIMFPDRFLADVACQQNLGEKTFETIQEVPRELNYSLYTNNGRLIFKGRVDQFIQSYKDSKTYLIKIAGYKTREIVFE